jgi:hypothetical protein
LLASASDGVRVQAEEFGQNAIASVSQLDRFQPGEQTALLLVEQAVEKQDGRFQFIGRYLKSRGIGQQRNRLGGLPGAELMARLPAIGGGVKESIKALCYDALSDSEELVNVAPALSISSGDNLLARPQKRVVKNAK